MDKHYNVNKFPYKGQLWKAACHLRTNLTQLISSPA